MALTDTDKPSQFSEPFLQGSDISLNVIMHHHTMCYPHCHLYASLHVILSSSESVNCFLGLPFRAQLGVDI